MLFIGMEECSVCNIFNEYELQHKFQQSKKIYKKRPDVLDNVDEEMKNIIVYCLLFIL